MALYQAVVKSSHVYHFPDRFFIRCYLVIAGAVFIPIIEVLFYHRTDKLTCFRTFLGSYAVNFLSAGVGLILFS